MVEGSYKICVTSRAIVRSLAPKELGMTQCAWPQYATTKPRALIQMRAE